MNMFPGIDPERHLEAGVTPGDSMLERTRQLVDAAYAEAGYDGDVFEKGELPETARVPLSEEGQVIDEAQRQRILAARAEVDAAYETTPTPDASQPENLQLR